MRGFTKVRCIVLSVVALAIMLAFGAPASADDIIQPTATQASSEFSGDFAAVHTINGSALSSAVPPGDPATVTHNGQGAPANTMWHTAAVTVSDQYIRYDLGAAYNITGMYVWNFDQYFGIDYSDFGIRAVNLGTQGPGGSLGGTYTSHGAIAEFDRAPTDAATLTPSQLIDLSSLSLTNTQFVELDIQTNWGYPGYVGFGEIRFVVATASSTPGTLIYGK